MRVVGRLYGDRGRVEKWLGKHEASLALMPFRVVEYVSGGERYRALFDEAAFHVSDDESLVFTVRNDLLKRGFSEVEVWGGKVVGGVEKGNRELLELYLGLVARLRGELEEVYGAKLQHARGTAKSIVSQMFLGGRRVDPEVERAAARATALEFILKIFVEELGLGREPEEVSGALERVYVPVAVEPGPVFYELVDKPRRSKIFNILYGRDEGYRRWIREKLGF